MSGRTAEARAEKQAAEFESFERRSPSLLSFLAVFVSLPLMPFAWTIGAMAGVVCVCVRLGWKDAQS